MRASQCYLGIPNAIVLCIDACEPDLKGCKYDIYHRNAETFQSGMEMLLKMEQLYNDLRFPFPGNNERLFVSKGNEEMKEKPKKVLEDDEVLEQHGDLGTFIVRVQHRQNSSWQGRLTWVEENKTVYFRSVWELMKLVNDALNHSKQSENDPDWDE